MFCACVAGKETCDKEAGILIGGAQALFLILLKYSRPD